MNLNEEQFAEFIDQTKDKFQRDTEFLIQCGWKKTDKTEFDGKKVFSVWESPDGVEYVHQNHLFADHKLAIDKAESDFIKKFGFKEIGYQNVTLKEKDIPKGKIYEKALYIHPNNGKVYTYDEAIEIARFNNESYLEDKNCCIATQQLNKIIFEQKLEIKPDMTLRIVMKRDDQDQLFFKFHSVEYRN